MQLPFYGAAPYISTSALLIVKFLIADSPVLIFQLDEYSSHRTPPRRLYSHLKATSLSQLSNLTTTDTPENPRPLPFIKSPIQHIPLSLSTPTPSVLLTLSLPKTTATPYVSSMAQTTTQHFHLPASCTYSLKISTQYKRFKSQPREISALNKFPLYSFRF